MSRLEHPDSPTRGRAENREARTALGGSHAAITASSVGCILPLMAKDEQLPTMLVFDRDGNRFDVGWSKPMKSLLVTVGRLIRLGVSGDRCHSIPIRPRNYATSSQKLIRDNSSGCGAGTRPASERVPRIENP